MYGDSRENLLEILAVVIILSTISSVRGYSIHVNWNYGVALVSRIDKIIGLFFKRDL